GVFVFMKMEIIILLSLVVGFILGNISKPVPTNLPKAFKESFNIKSKTTISSPFKRKESENLIHDISE
ncbi:MAG: hypothetical protein AAB875_00560, partial [Patescibacteria group bacterium]